MTDYKKSLYNIAINGQGYILSGIPTRPARQMGQARVLGMEPSQIDLEYKDSSAFLPWAQTDWSGGFQKEEWEDSATFKKGTDLKYIEKYGELTLDHPKSATVKDFGAGFTFGAAIEFNRDTIGMVIGVTKTSGASTLWKIDTSDSSTAITGGTWANVDAVHNMDELQGKVYMGLTVSSGNPLKTYDGSTVADISLLSELNTCKTVKMVKRIESRLYVGGYTENVAEGYALMYSDDAGTTWTAIITKTGRNREITQGVDNLGTLYFLIEDGSKTELWWCNDTSITQIYRWDNLTNPRIKAWLGKVFIEGEQDGKLFRFEWNGATLKTIFEESTDSLDLAPSPMIIYKNNLCSYGLIYDGLFHFPSWVFKYTANKIYPFIVFGSATTQVPYFYGLSGTNLIITKLNTSAYNATGNTITGRYTAKKVAVDKLWHSVSLNFKALLENEAIQVYYSVDDEANWTSLGTAGVDGTEEKVLYFPANTKSKRIQLKFTLGCSGGATTPTLFDFITRFLVLPEDKLSWRMKLNCSDKLILLDGKTFEPKRSSELRNLLIIANIKNEIIELQDTDFAETIINDGSNITASDTTITVDSTLGFPEQGRIKIGQEEILYTGKTALEFTGCDRGARGTRAVIHLDDARVHNAYNVITVSVSETNPVAPFPKTTESIVNITLIEV